MPCPFCSAAFPSPNLQVSLISESAGAVWTEHPWWLTERAVPILWVTGSSQQRGDPAHIPVFMCVKSPVLPNFPQYTLHVREINSEIHRMFLVEVTLKNTWNFMILLAIHEKMSYWLLSVVPLWVPVGNTLDITAWPCGQRPIWILSLNILAVWQ